MKNTTNHQQKHLLLFTQAPDIAILHYITNFYYKITTHQTTINSFALYEMCSMYDLF